MSEELFDIKDLLGDNADFELPRLIKFVKNQNLRNAILNSCRIVPGRYGEMAIVTFQVGKKEESYRTYCKNIVEEVNNLLEHGKFPINVKVFSFQTEKSEHPSYTLNG